MENKPGMKKKSRIGGGQLRPSVSLKVFIALYLVGMIAYSIYAYTTIISDANINLFPGNVWHLISAPVMVFVSGNWLWLLNKPYNTIMWDANYLIVNNKTGIRHHVIERSEIKSIDLKLNDLYLVMKNGERMHFDVTDMYLKYSEINRFKKDLALN